MGNQDQFHRKHHLFLKRVSEYSLELLCLLLVVLQLSCRAKGVIRLTLPPTPKVSIFKTASSSIPTVSVKEDIDTLQSFDLSFPKEAFEENAFTDTIKKTCVEILEITSSNESFVANSSISVSDIDGGCRVFYQPKPNASGSLLLTVTSKKNPADKIEIPVTIEAINDPPVVADLIPSVSGEDSRGDIVIAFVDDSPDLQCSTAIKAHSHNESLLPDSNITLSGSPPECLLTYIPVAEQAGTAELSLTISDGEFSIPKTVSVSVNAIHDAPVISDVSNQTTFEDTILNGVAVNITDADYPLDCSAITATSSNTTLIPSASVTISGTAPNCLVSMSPALNQNGSSTITLTVTDGALTATDTFILTVNAVHDSPVISDVANQITSEDNVLTGVVVNISDLETTLACTAITASSSNTTLIPSGNITISGTASNCLVSMSPALDQNGSSTITLTVTDGALAASDTYTLTVTAVNDAPVISDVADQRTWEDTDLIGVAVSITDADGALTCASIAATSSNVTLIPSASVTISGTAPNCDVNLNPALNQSGTSTITLTVTDGTLSAIDSFDLTVAPVNDAPTDLALSSLSIAENAGLNALVGNLSGTDPDTADTFSYSLVTGTGSTDNTSFNILGNQLRMNASADFETKSSYDIRLRVTDQGSLFFEKQLDITITNVNDAPIIASIANQTTTQNTPTSAIAITITDVDGPAGICNSTYLSYTSQSTSVVASNDAVTWSGTWPNCTVVITPISSATGSSVIAISAFDGSLTSSPQSFTLNVNASLGWYQEAYLKASNANASDYFGYAVSLSGDTAIVGAYLEDSIQTTITNGSTSSADNTATDAGASYIYKRTDSSWAQEAYLKASNAYGNDRYGTSVALSGDTAVVGAYFQDSNQTTITNGSTSSTDKSAPAAGASYIYKRTGSTWSQEAYLKASNANDSDNFGYSVSLSGDTAIVGARWEASNQAAITVGTASSTDNTALYAGASYIYKRTGSTWAQEAYLKASNANASDYFGFSVALSGDTAVVGAYNEGSNQTTITNGTTSSADNTALSAGASYIYKRTGSTWAQEAYLKASNAEASDRFGSSVALSGDNLVVGAYNEDSNQTTITNGTTSSADDTATNAGASYIYKRTRSTWTQEAYLKASNAEASDFFGTSVAIEGDTIVVGADAEDSNQTTITNGTTSSADNTATNAGASYIYKRTGSTWAQEAYLKASNANGNDSFGRSVAISGDTAVVAALNEDSNQTTITNGSTSSTDNTALSAGAVYVYRNLSRTFEAHEILSSATISSFALSWNGSNLGSGNGTFKVVYSTSAPGANCSSGTVAYTGTATSVTVSSGLTPGQSYIVRICTFDGASYSEGITTEVKIKGEEIGPTVLNITRGTTPNPAPMGTPLIDYIVTFDEPVIGVSSGHFSFTEVVTASGASGQVSSISCSGSVCTVWVAPGNSGQLRLDLTNLSGISDVWGNPLASGKTGDETFTLRGWHQEAYIKASNADSYDFFGSSFAISGDTVVVGAPGEASNQTTITNGTTSILDKTASAAGASYIYKRTGSTWAQEAYLKASNANASDYFGYKVALSGDSAVIGAYEEDSNQTTITNGTTSSTDNTVGSAGASYIYKRTGSTWAQEAYLKASNANGNDSFGRSVAISGDSAVIGAYAEDSNQTTITNGTTSSADNTSGDAGASYIYKRTGSTWAQEAYLKASNAEASDGFGYSVALSGDTAVVGAPGEASNQTTITNGTTSSADNTAFGPGASYIYKRTGSAWAQEAYLKASNTNANYDHGFGDSVAISGDTAVIGAYAEDANQTTITNGTTSSADDTATNAGASYIYKRTRSTWTQEAYLKASNAAANDWFGISVAISGDTVAVGSDLESSNQTTITNGTTSSADNSAIWAGASYIYKRTGSTWAQEAYLKASNANRYDRFGFSVALSGATAVVGSYEEASNQTTITNGSTSSADNTATSAGAVYVYRNPSRLFDPDLFVSAKTSTSVTLSWGSNLGSTAQVKIVPAVLGNDNPLPCTDSAAITLGTGVTSYVYSGLTTATSYGFRVCGFDGTNVSEGAVIRETTD